MIFYDVETREPILRKYFCRGRHSNCNIIYVYQNLFSTDKQSVRANCNIFVLFEQRVKAITAIYYNFFYNVELSYIDSSKICENVWRVPYNYIVIDETKKN